MVAHVLLNIRRTAVPLPPATRDILNQHIARIPTDSHRGAILPLLSV